MDEMDRESRIKYAEAVTQRADPIGHEMQVLQASYKSLAELSPQAGKRVLAYLNAVMGERLN